MMVRSGTALAKAASSGSCGKYSHASKDNPIRASTRAPSRNWSLASCPSVLCAAVDGGGSAPGAVETAGAGRGQPLNEFDFPDRTHLLRAVSPVHRSGLDEHRGPHVMPAVDVGTQLVEQIPLVGYARGAKVPEMVMGVADGHLRFQRRFLGQGEPIIA